MSTNAQNGSHLTIIQTREQRLEQIAKVEHMIIAEKARIYETQEMLLRKASEMGARLTDPEDDEPQPETDELPSRWRVYAISWLVVLLASTTLAVGYRLAVEIQPELDLFHVSQVGSVEGGEG